MKAKRGLWSPCFRSQKNARPHGGGGGRFSKSRRHALGGSSNRPQTSGTSGGGTGRRLRRKDVPRRALDHPRDARLEHDRPPVEDLPVDKILVAADPILDRELGAVGGVGTAAVKARRHVEH